MALGTLLNSVKFRVCATTSLCRDDEEKPSFGKKKPSLGKKNQALGRKNRALRRKTEPWEEKTEPWEEKPEPWEETKQKKKTLPLLYVALYFVNGALQ